VVWIFRRSWSCWWFCWWLLSLSWLALSLRHPKLSNRRASLDTVVCNDTLENLSITSNPILSAFSVPLCCPYFDCCGLFWIFLCIALLYFKVQLHINAQWLFASLQILCFHGHNVLVAHTVFACVCSVVVSEASKQKSHYKGVWSEKNVLRLFWVLHIICLQYCSGGSRANRGNGQNRESCETQFMASWKGRSDASLITLYTCRLQKADAVSK